MIGYSYDFSATGALWMLIFAALIVIPFWRLLPDYGLPRWVAVLAVLPFVALILLWVMAFRPRTAATA
jgi:hypothetical protein